MQTTLRILRDNTWQFVGAIFSALAILVTYNIFFLEREVKELQVVILASTSLVEVEQSITEDIKVLYKDQPIANLSLVQVKVENSGNQAIREEDYAQPIKFVFPSQAEIVEAVVLESSPPNIGITVQMEQNTAILSPVLLNEEDQVIIRLLVVNVPTNYDEQPFEVNARIAEVKDIHVVSAIEGREKEPNRLLETVAVLAAAAVGFVADHMVSKFDPAKRLIIHSATYGAESVTKDVTQLLSSKISAGEPQISVCNDDLGGDPSPGLAKELRVVYSSAGQIHSITVSEGQELPLSTVKPRKVWGRVGTIVVVTGVLIALAWLVPKWLSEIPKVTPTSSPIHMLVISTTTPTSTPFPPTATPTFTPSPMPTPVSPTDTPPPAPTGMVYIPAGDFLMGSDSEKDGQAKDDELPQHWVYLDAFFIDRTEVTNEQFAKFVQETEYEPRGEGSIWKQGSKLVPTEGVNWRHPQDPYDDWFVDLHKLIPPAPSKSHTPNQGKPALVLARGRRFARLSILSVSAA